MKKQTRKRLSTVLSATMLMSMFTAMPVNAVDNVAEESDQSRLINSVQEDANTQLGATGDNTLIDEIPDNVDVIDSVSEYYKLQGKKYKVPSGSSASAGLPSSVDNSQSKYFPAVGDQKSLGACVAWAQAYYQFTYTMNKAMGVATTPENTFSPKFVYNNVNKGKDDGLSAEFAYEFMMYQGNVPISMVPYDNDYLSWCPTEDVWKSSIKYRVKDYQFFESLGNEETAITSPDDSDLEAVKTALSNGEVLSFSTFAYSFDKVKLTQNVDAPENSKYPNEYAIAKLTGMEGSHRMALVGYNDNIWTDINKNQKVDNGEMGAFKIVNSWGEDFGNKGFIWVAYDALNNVSVVEGAPETPKRTALMGSIARIDVVPYNTAGNLYFKYTWNSANRNLTKAVVTAELNGTKYSAPVYTMYTVGVSRGDYSYDGTKNSNDGTMVLALNNVFSEITSENITNCNWSVTFTDSKKDNVPLTVKNAEIVDATRNRVLKLENPYPFTLDGTEKTVELHKTDLNDTVIYYRGYDKPNLHYKVNNGAWTTQNGVPMTYNIEKRGYLYKYIINLSQASDVTLYFSDNKGNIDNNNGNYYKANRGLNYFATENVAQPLIGKVECTDTKISSEKMLNFVASATGGYAPYQYQYIFKNLDTGKAVEKNYLDKNDTTNYFDVAGNYRVTVNVKDYSDKVVSTYIDMKLEKKPFEYTEFTVTPNHQVMVGDTVELYALTNYENIDYAGYAKNTHDIAVKDSAGATVHSATIRSTNFSLSGKTSKLNYSWMPRKADNYSITIFSTGSKKQYCEKTINLSVTEYNGTIIGDANNDKVLDIRDALLLMKCAVGGADESNVWFALSDCNDDKETNIRDVIFILKYLIHSDNTANTGRVNYRELPTEPPTEPPTEKPTEAPTNPVEDNLVAFVNSANWSGTIYCYYWSDTNKSMTTWPGKPMTKAGNDSSGKPLYTYKLPKGATYVIFTNSNEQTVDITYTGGSKKYTPTTKDSMGHYKVNVGTYL
ncbi:MAG: starch-binding protein [Acutalibacteraceae bacterium]|nr:starch-binding protein [Acutalibacteraceae bacterium]